MPRIFRPHAPEGGILASSECTNALILGSIRKLADCFPPVEIGRPKRWRIPSPMAASENRFVRAARIIVTLRPFKFPRVLTLSHPGEPGQSIRRSPRKPRAFFSSPSPIARGTPDISRFLYFQSLVQDLDSMVDGGRPRSGRPGNRTRSPCGVRKRPSPTSLR